MFELLKGQDFFKGVNFQKNMKIEYFAYILAIFVTSRGVMASLGPLLGQSLIFKLIFVTTDEIFSNAS